MDSFELEIEKTMRLVDVMVNRNMQQNQTVVWIALGFVQVHLQSNMIYLEHPAFVDVSPLDMSFPAKHLGQHLHCWNMLEQVSLSKQIPMIFHFGPLH